MRGKIEEAFWFIFRAKFRNISDNCCFDWLLHQNVFPLSDSNSILSGKGSGFTFQEFFRSPFTELAFEFDYTKEFIMKVFIQIHQT